jgi:uncharacterized membrane protein YsdA (DUF1294 family)/cold shock CspA family protein
MRQVGRLVKWDESRGFGFIQPAAGGPQVFVHISKFADRRRPVVGAELSFEVARDLQNRLSASHVRHGGVVPPKPGVSRQASPRPAGPLWPAASIAICALLAIGLAAHQGRLPPLIPVVFVVASLTVFLAYAFDKSAAMNRRRRTPENFLHLMNLLGGWPGGLIASRLFRHKSKKIEFRSVFYVCIALNCAALGWWAYARPF